MNKTLRLFALCGALSAGLLSCNKEDKKDSPAPTPESPYYFDFTLDGEHARFANPEGQYSYMLGGVGGFQQPSATVHYPDIELSFIFGKQATDADVKALAGHRYRFNSWDKNDETTVFMAYTSSFGSASWMDTDDSSWNNYVQVDKVTFVKVDSVLGTPLDIYEVKGSCKTMMEDDQSTTTKLLEGTFNMLVSRVKREGE